jgi:hypothetical protein
MKLHTKKKERKLFQAFANRSMITLYQPLKNSVFLIQIRKFLGLPDPDPDPPSTSKKSKRALISTLL